MAKRILIVMLLAGSLFGQNSNYSSYGFGLSSPSIPVRNLALGGTGLAIPDSISLNLLNPALWNGFSTTSLQGQVGTSTVGADPGTPDLVMTQFLGFSFKLPIGKKIGIAMGIMPITRMTTEKSFSDSTSFGSSMMQYTSDVDVKGGISQFFFGGGYRVNPNFCLGLKTQIYFGNYLTKMATNLETDDVVNSYFRKYTIMQGTQLGLGAYWVSKDRKMEVGATIDHRLKFDSYSNYDFYFGPDSTTKKKNIPYPSTFQLGVRRKMTGSLALSVDVSYSLVPKSLYKDFYVIETSDAQNPFYAGIGFEKATAPRPGASIWNQMALRAGAFHKSESIHQSGGLQETGISFGVSLPFNRHLNRIDLAIVASIRDGFLNETVGKEKVLSFYAGITTGELWFRKFKRF
ncbi:MAG: hypothetical protein H8D42_01585 [Candidatus Marinimicrobia bacterium]|nr:hypothetical protein [Candidatus Neomarinimicrobiota bacterium]MBL7066554.1 hypothetical protein [Candidatus Neomarinimicrobiota bacterium]